MIINGSAPDSAPLHRRAPAANGADRLGGVVIDADADATGVRADVVNCVRNGFAEFLVDEVVHIDLVGTASER